MPSTTYRMGNVTWRAWIGPGRIGLIHNEPVLLQRVPLTKGFTWTAKRRRTGEEWSGTTILGLIQQIWCDLHGEQFDVDEAAPDDGNYERCVDCAPEGGDHA